MNGEITVHHRSDRLLHQSVKGEGPEEPVSSFFRDVTLPAHEALLAFLNKDVVGQSFDSLEQLNAKLAEWPGYYSGRVCQTDKVFAQLFITTVHGEQVIACPGEMGGAFVVARLES